MGKRGRPKKLSTLDKILALAPKPEPVAPRDLYGERRLREGRSMPRYRHMTAKQRKVAEASTKGRKAVKPRTRDGAGRYNGKPWPLGERQIDRIVLAMEPDKWYCAGDLARATGARKRRAEELPRYGYAERAQNSAWPGYKVVKELWPAVCVREPKWFFRLTPLGEAVRAALVVLGV